jgi:WD40 repeat protein
VAFSSDGDSIVTASNDATAKLWDTKTCAFLLTLKGHANRMHAASFSPDGSRVVTPSEGGTARLWDLKAGASLLIITRSANFGSTASFSSGGSLVISAYAVASPQKP